MALGKTDYFGYGLFPLEWLGFKPLNEDDGEVENYDEGALNTFAYADYLNELEKEATKEANEFALSSAREANRFASEEAQIQRLWQNEQNLRAMAFESQEALKSRQWQENMSNTAYQRAILDMKQAGLNPILAYNQGGAATTSGAVASGFSTGSSSAASQMASAHKASYSKENISMELLKMIVSSATDLITSVIGKTKVN